MIRHRALLAASVLALLVAAPFAVPARAQDASDNYVRINRLENQVRTLSGQIEQLQFANKRLTDQFQKFQEDVEYRFQERSGAKPGARPATGQGAATPQKRGDAYDPGEGVPGTPLTGAPAQLGQTQPSQPLQSNEMAQSAPLRGIPPGAGSPLAEAGGGVQVLDDSNSEVGAPLDINALSRTGSLPAGQGGAALGRPSIAAADDGQPGNGYESAAAMMQQRQYEGAEMALRQFLQSHPRDPKAADATYLLGESYFQRGRYEEAGQQFLKVSTDYPKTARAPEAMLKLGVSLNQIGAKEQACATFAKAGRDYPQASDSLRRGLDRERAKARCAA